MISSTNLFKNPNYFLETKWEARWKSKQNKGKEIFWGMTPEEIWNVHCSIVIATIGSIIWEELGLLNPIANLNY